MWQPQEWLAQQTKLCQERGRGLFIANVQYVPQLLPLMQAAAENGLYVATASQLCALQEFLPGVPVIELPLSAGGNACSSYDDGSDMPFFLPDCWAPDEAGLKAWQDAFSGSRAVWQQVFRGALAGKLFSDGASRERFYAEYLQNLWQCEIKELANVSDELKFYRFLRAAAMAGGSVMNYANLANAAEITSPTAKSWLKLLAGAGVVRFLEPVAVIGSRRLAKAPKLYFTDTGLAAYLLHLVDTQALAASGYAAALWETYVLACIYQSWLQGLKRPRLSYYRDSNAKEISLLLEKDSTLYPMEIKRDRSSLKACAKKLRLLDPLSDSGLRVGPGTLVNPGEILKL